MALLVTIQTQRATSWASHAPLAARTSPAAMVPRPLNRTLTPVLGRMRSAFEREDLAAVSGLFVDTKLARSVRSTMQRWIEEGVSPLRVSLVYAHSLGPNRYVGTVKFWSDPRAIPTYMIFVFQRGKAGVHIAGTLTGISG